VAKALAHFCAVNYRDAYSMFVSTVILFNHESALRPEAFVTRKITSAAVRISAGLQDTLELGRLDIRRDWGSAADFTRAMSMVLAHSEPGDFVVASGTSHSLGEFVQESFRAAGAGDPAGAVRTNPEFVRPTDIPETRGDPTRLREQLGWSCEFGFCQIVDEMVAIDRERLKSGREHDRNYMR
jgi:GDPmannose 4,6-dehydratase